MKMGLQSTAKHTLTHNHTLQPIETSTAKYKHINKCKVILILRKAREQRREILLYDFDWI